MLDGSSGQDEEWLVDARVDIAILHRYGAALPEHEDALAAVHRCLIGPAGDALTADDELAFATLDGLPYILPGAPNGLRTTLDALASRAHIAPLGRLGLGNGVLVHPSACGEDHALVGRPPRPDQRGRGKAGMPARTQR